MSGIVYVLNDDNLIIDQMEMPFDDAIKKYHNKRNSKGQRYWVGVIGIEPPFKYAPKKLHDLKYVTDQKPERSEAHTPIKAQQIT